MTLACNCWARLSAVLVGSLLLQLCVLDQVVVLGSHPDVMVLLPVAAGLLTGSQRGAVVGFVAGLFADLVVDLPFGLSSLTFVLLGFGAGLLASVPIGRELPGAEAFMCAALAGAGTVLYALLGALVGQPDMLGTQSLRAFSVVIIGALILARPVLFAIRWAFAASGSGASYSVPSGGSAFG